MKKYILLSLMFMVAGGMNIVGMEPQKTCDICLENKSTYDFIQPLSCCAHDASCTDCLLEQLNASLEEKTTAYINCPNRNCANPMSTQDIQAITHANPEKFRMFCDIATYEALTKNEKFIKHCQTANCTYSFINENGLKVPFNCPECKKIYCSNCLVKHAQEMTCEEAHEYAKIINNKDQEKIANEEWLQKNTKACPQCKVSVQKNGGCNHMTCKQCNHQFCWTCTATYGSTRCNSNWCEKTNQRAEQNENIGNDQALLFAAQNGNIAIVQLLLNAADITHLLQQPDNNEIISINPAQNEQ